MKFRQSHAQAPVLSEREIFENKYRVARHNLLIVVIFTLLNVLMLLLQSDTYLLFSASIPYYLVFYGMIFTGKMPEERYGGEMAEYVVFDNSFFVVMLVLALMCIAFYVLFWFFSRKISTGWLIAALVFIALDTVGMFLLIGFDASMILDVLFHAWIIYEMVVGIITARKLKNLPPETETLAEDDPFAVPPESIDSTDSEN